MFFTGLTLSLCSTESKLQGPPEEPKKTKLKSVQKNTGKSKVDACQKSIDKALDIRKKVLVEFTTSKNKKYKHIIEETNVNALGEVNRISNLKPQILIEVRKYLDHLNAEEGVLYTNKNIIIIGTFRYARPIARHDCHGITINRVKPIPLKPVYSPFHWQIIKRKESQIVFDSSMVEIGVFEKRSLSQKRVHGYGSCISGGPKKEHQRKLPYFDSLQDNKLVLKFSSGCIEESLKRYSASFDLTTGDLVKLQRLER